MEHPFLKYHSYYSDPGIREVCHAVKQSTDLDARQASINSMADYFSNLGVFDSSCILIPAPQHSGNAEYTKTISEIVSKRTGATMLDIVKCQPHEPLYDQKYKGNKVLDLDLYLAGKVPEGKKIILIDNVISTGETVFKISNLLKKPVIPVVYAIDDTRFKRWSELNNMIDKAMKTQQSADKEITINSTDEERTRILSKQELLVVPWDRQKELFIEDPSESTSHALNRYMDEHGLRGKEILFPGFGESIRFTTTTLNESIHQMTKRHANLINLGKLLSVVEDVCANSVKIEVEQYRHRGTVTRNDVKQVHQYMSAFHDTASIYPVKITINETEKKQRNRFYMVITVGEIGIDKIKEAITNTGMHSDKSEESLSAGDASFTITIAEFISNFNREEGIILKNLPDGLLNEDQKQIKQKIVKTDVQRELNAAAKKGKPTIQASPGVNLMEPKDTSSNKYLSFNSNISIDGSGSAIVTPLVSRSLSKQWKDLKENFIHNLRSFTDDAKFAVQSLGNAIKEAAKPSGKYEIADRSAEIEKPKEVRKAKIDRSNKPNLQNDTLKSKQKEVEEYKKEHTVSPQQHNKNRGR